MAGHTAPGGGGPGASRPAGAVGPKAGGLVKAVIKKFGRLDILVNGTRTNPMKVRMPSGRALAGAELKRFEAARARIENQYAALPAAPDAADARLVEVRD